MDINVALKAFIRTVEKGSITAAARDLGVTQPAVTKHISNLERHVQARLLERSSKIVRPTAHGLELYEASRIAIASIDAALEGVRINTGEIEGNLRIHAPSCIGVGHLERIVGNFRMSIAGSPSNWLSTSAQSTWSMIISICQSTTAKSRIRTSSHAASVGWSDFL